AAHGAGAAGADGEGGHRAAVGHTAREMTARSGRGLGRPHALLVAAARDRDGPAGDLGRVLDAPRVAPPAALVDATRAAAAARAGCTRRATPCPPCRRNRRATPPPRESWATKICSSSSSWTVTKPTTRPSTVATVVWGRRGGTRARKSTSRRCGCRDSGT